MQGNNKRTFAVPWISEMYILAMLSHADSYGYEIVRTNGLSLNDSTVYPILRRLEETGCLESHSQVCDSKLCRSYTITEAGHGQLMRLKAQWVEYKNRVEFLFNDKNSHEK